MNRVKRVQRDEARTHFVRQPVDRVLEVTKVSTAPVAFRPDCVQSDGYPARAQVFRQVGMVRGNNPRHASRKRSNGNRNLVVTQRSTLRQWNCFSDILAFLKFRCFEHRQGMQFDVRYTRAIVLQPYFDARPCVRQLNRKTRHHLLRLRLAGNQAVGK